MSTKDKIHNLLKRLPHKLQIRFALACAEDVFQCVKDKDKAVMRSCLDTTSLWLQDKATAEETSIAANAAYYVVSNAYYAASYAYYAAYYAANAASNDHYAAFYAANAAYNAAKVYNKDLGYYLNILKTMIKDLSKLERLFYDLNKEEI